MDAGYLPVPPQLAHAVKAMWFARGTQAEFAHSDPIAPDGCVEMVFNLGDPFAEVHGCGRPSLQPRSLLVGQMTRPTSTIPTGAVDMLGVRFWPSRAGDVLRLPMWELLDRMAPLSDVLPSSDAWVHELQALAPSDRVACVGGQLERHCRRVDPTRLRLVEGAWTTIVRLRGDVSIEQVARRMGVSRRHLEREFRERVGLGAKAAARIVRVHAALRLLDAAPHAGGAEIASRCGFSDQAHLIHECRAIAGVTPARLRPGVSTLATLMRDSHRG